MKNDLEEYNKIYKGSLKRQIDCIDKFEKDRWICNRINQYPSKSKVLDIGCSIGMLGYILREPLSVNEFDMNINSYEYTGMDYIDELIQECKDTIQGCSFILHDATKINKELIDSFDVVIISQLLEHVYEYKTVVENAYKYLKDGGMLIITVPLENRLPSKAHVKQFDFYTLVEMMEEISENYKIIRMRKYKDTKKDNILGLICYKGDEYGKGRTFDR